MMEQETKIFILGSSLFLTLAICGVFGVIILNPDNEKDNQTITNLTTKLNESKQTITELVESNIRYSIELKKQQESFNLSCGNVYSNNSYYYLKQIQALEIDNEKQYFIGYNQGYVDCRNKWDTNVMASTDCNKANLTYTGVKGVYWSNDDFYCVYAKNQDKTDMEKKDAELYCHSLVHNNYEHFCGNKEDMLIKYGGCTPCLN
jgi:regulator of replication initiation timing